MKLKIYLFICLYLLLFSPFVLAQTKIGINIDHAEEKIVKVTVPLSYLGNDLDILWHNQFGDKEYKVRFCPNSGENIFDMRLYPEWKGNVRDVFVGYNSSLCEIKGVVVKPSILDEVKIFFLPERFSGSTCHLLHAPRFLTIPWNIYLLIVLFISMVIFFSFFKKPIMLSFLFGFVIASALMDLRIIYDHLKIVQKVKEDNFVITPSYQKNKELSQAFVKQIGGGTWTLDIQEGNKHFLVKYNLAECRYLPYGVDNKSDFVIREKNGLITCEKMVK